MAGYCLVCSRELSRDRHAKPPYCRQHVDRKRLRNRRYANKAEERQVVSAAFAGAPYRHLYLTDITPTHSTDIQILTANLVIERRGSLTRQGSRIHVQPVTFMGRVRANTLTAQTRGNLRAHLNRCYLLLRVEG